MNQEQIDQANELRAQQENDSERLNVNSRPKADSKIPQFNKELTNSEIAYINKIYHRVNDEKHKTIMDLPLDHGVTSTLQDKLGLLGHGEKPLSILML